jgi:hypothetical protein
VLAVNEAERAVGERLVEELDVTVATDTMKQASDRVRVLESALGVAIQKDEAAETALKDAGWAVKLDAESDALAQLKAVAVRGDRIMGELESLVREEFTPALAAAYAATAACGRSEGQTAFLHAFRQAFVLCVNRACTPYIPDARAGLPAFKDRTWSSWISEQDRMGMTSYAQAKPIPGWQSGE